MDRLKSKVRSLAERDYALLQPGTGKCEMNQLSSRSYGDACSLYWSVLFDCPSDDALGFAGYGIPDGSFRDHLRLSSAAATACCLSPRIHSTRGVSFRDRHRRLGSCARVRVCALTLSRAACACAFASACSWVGGSGSGSGSGWVRPGSAPGAGADLEAGGVGGWLHVEGRRARGPCFVSPGPAHPRPDPCELARWRLAAFVKYVQPASRALINTRLPGWMGRQCICCLRRSCAS
jgi:hypothetical protein